MNETKCSSFNTLSAASNMDSHRQNEKDVSNVFNFLRSKLNAKEKELLELQRAEPCLLAPDQKQIEMLVDAISSLHLSTQDGSFVVAPKAVSDHCSSTAVCPTGVNDIKTLPSTVWLSKSEHIGREEDDKQPFRLPMVTHLLSLPLHAFVISSSNTSKLPALDESVQNTSEPSNRLPAVSQLLSMPMSAFKSTNSIQSKNETPLAKIEESTTIINSKDDSVPRQETATSILTTGSIYSKEYWLHKSSPSESEVASLDLDKYIEQTTEKMRRLHMQYLEALEKLKTPSNAVDCPEALKSMYPNMFDRVKQDTAAKSMTDVLSSNK